MRTLNNDIRHDDNQHNDTQDNDILPDDTQHNVTLSISTLSIKATVILSVANKPVMLNSVIPSVVATSSLL
jgi:hypothetical protein